MTLIREELEREIVNYDKQKLITQCLKLFDSNVRLVDELGATRASRVILKDEIKELKIDNNRLELRTIWQVLNERIALRTEKIRKRNASFNYPVK